MHTVSPLCICRPNHNDVSLLIHTLHKSYKLRCCAYVLRVLLCVPKYTMLPTVYRISFVCVLIFDHIYQGTHTHTHSHMDLVSTGFSTLIIQPYTETHTDYPLLCTEIDTIVSLQLCIHCVCVAWVVLGAFRAALFVRRVCLVYIYSRSFGFGSGEPAFLFE